MNNLLNKKNVVGVGIGEKWSDGRNTGEESVVVFVSKKVKLSDLSINDRIPKRINNMVTDVIGKSNKFESFAYTKKERPAVGGISIGHPRITAGTIGGFFTDKDDDVVMLSNNHVLANNNKGNVIGYKGKPGSISCQPGLYDRKRGWMGNAIGHLKDYEKINFIGTNVQDSAITLVEKPYLDKIKTIGKIFGFSHVSVGDRVKKVGRTTQKTVGDVISTGTTVKVYYGKGKIVIFKDQIITRNMGAGGDSGSLLLDMNNNVVGLLFAGSSRFTVFNKIDYIRQRYGLKIIDTSINENIWFSVKVNGDSVPNDYGINDVGKAIKNARNLALSGKSVDIAVFYSVDKNN